jgi:ATP-dependent helicase/nuclease subunit B
MTQMPASLKAASRPEPKPEVAVRPRRFSVTEAEQLVRDPYGLYARRILRLKPLDRPHAPFEARTRGTALHRAAERFVAEDQTLGEAGEAAFITLIEEAFAAAHLDEAQCALQRPFLGDIARHYIDFESQRRAGNPRLLIEQRGELNFTLKGSDYQLTARADRIEINEDALHLIDFKSGRAPNVKEVMAGFSRNALWPVRRY